MTPSSIPRLELTEDPNKKNDYIIFRHSIKGKIKKTATKRATNKKGTSKKSKTKKSKKGVFNIFYN